MNATLQEATLSDTAAVDNILPMDSKKAVWQIIAPGPVLKDDAEIPTIEN